jgi:hypothetical protein
MDKLVTFSSDVADPQPTPPRPPGSIRRTSHIDMSFPAGGGLRLDGTCRDLATATEMSTTSATTTSEFRDSTRSSSLPDPAPASAAVHEHEPLLAPGMGGRRVAQATVSAALAADYTLLDLVTTGGAVDAAMLQGLPVRAGFRARLDQAMPADGMGSPLFVLLDELPVVALISGYALMYRGQLGHHQSGARDRMTDVCSGWRADGLMIQSIRATGSMPIPVGPDAPGPETDDETGDPLGWHPLPTLPRGSMRRRRLIDVSRAPHGGFAVFATFRDTYVGDENVQRVLHEYTLVAAVDAQGRISSCVATPRVLPWNECPHAAASAERLVGQHPAEIREAMRGVRGVGTCTHLNDLLRSLGDLDVLTGAISQ